MYTVLFFLCSLIVLHPGPGKGKKGPDQKPRPFLFGLVGFDGQVRSALAFLIWSALCVPRLDRTGPLSCPAEKTRTLKENFHSRRLPTQSVVWRRRRFTFVPGHCAIPDGSEPIVAHQTPTTGSGTQPSRPTSAAAAAAVAAVPYVTYSRPWPPPP